MSLTTPELDPELLAGIEGLQLAARQIAEGAMAGTHRSTRRGSSIEFSEHKLYAPGDEIRHIDWRAYGKTDRYHVKQFEDETNQRVELLVDRSASMGFAGKEQQAPKLVYARQLAAAMSYLALRQGDSLGLVTFARGESDDLPGRATSSHLVEVLRRLAALTPAGATSLVEALDTFTQRHRRRSLVVVLSDLFDPDPNLVDAFGRLAAHGHEVAVLHLLDPAECDFPYDNPANFLSMEDPRRLFVHPRTLRAAYVRELGLFLERTERALASVGVEYVRIITDEDPALALARFLRSHARGMAAQ